MGGKVESFPLMVWQIACRVIRHDWCHRPALARGKTGDEQFCDPVAECVARGQCAQFLHGIVVVKNFHCHDVGSNARDRLRGVVRVQSKVSRMADWAHQINTTQADSIMTDMKPIVELTLTE